MKATTTIILAFLLLACGTGPQPINYGSDACHFCKMTIVDKPFGCEMVTSQGKVTKYDAIECLVAHFKASGSDTTNSIYVADFASPGTLFDGKQATYLHCEAIPSPMGAFLSAHRNAMNAEKAQGGNAGILHDWEELLTSNY